MTMNHVASCGSIVMSVADKQSTPSLTVPFIKLSKSGPKPQVGKSLLLHFVYLVIRFHYGNDLYG